MDILRNAWNFPILKSGLALSFVIVFGYKYLASPYFKGRHYDEQEMLAMQLYEMRQKNMQGKQSEDSSRQSPSHQS